ncbi:MAG: ATP-dependent helicase, partial [Acidobacteria bacterium]|nr:ATP-dependent helicase [Acidobacteriota bacterium]
MLRVRTSPNLGAKTTPFPHQLDAFRAIKDLPYAAIFHEQGLGKTKIAVDLVLYWLVRDVVDSALIVVKKGLLGTWRSEVSRHSHLMPRLLGQDRNANFYAFNSPARLYLVHYEALLSERKRFQLFLRTRRVGAILDEAHKIKNPEARISQALHALSDGFVRRVIMTGTPVANRPYDLWSQIHFLDGGATLGRDFSAIRRTLDLANDLGHSASRNAAFG